jgi:hypothetical protein
VSEGGTCGERRARADAEHGHGAAMAWCVVSSYSVLEQRRGSGAHQEVAVVMARRPRARGARVGDPVVGLGGEVGEEVTVAVAGDDVELGAEVVEASAAVSVPQLREQGLLQSTAHLWVKVARIEAGGGGWWV